MNEYENVIIIKPNLSKKELYKLKSKVENKINEFAEITKKNDLGIKKLAYEIRKNKEGHYLIYEFKINDDLKNKAISEIERLYRITDEIMKFIIVKNKERG